MILQILQLPEFLGVYYAGNFFLAFALLSASMFTRLESYGRIMEDYEAHKEII